MKMRAIATLGLSAFVFGGTMVGCTHGGGIASASARSEAALAKQAATSATKATKALAKGDALAGVSFAEAAVTMQPRDLGYRTLLAQSYLKAGRFGSAQAAYADVLTLSPDNGRAALNLALAQIAGGRWDEARRTLDTHATAIDPADRGLAIALAGDPSAGVALLTAATRSPTATAKTRQNLALAMALAGQWREARAVVGTDLAPAEADARIVQWASFAKPAHAADQVASLLGVTPVADPGQPAALALNTVVPATPAMPVEAVAIAAPIATPTIAPVVVASNAPATAAAFAGVKFAAPQEVAQPIPASLFPAAKVATIRAEGAYRRPAAVAVPQKGDWFVQIGAFSSADVARDAWSRAQRRFAAFGGKVPNGAGYKSFYRLSIGGFTRANADATCRAYRATGGMCFVRAGAGDQTAQWLRTGGTQLASR